MQNLKIMTILGTRPEIIRLCVLIKKLDLSCDHILLHTGQNYDNALHDIFFQDLDLRLPDIQLTSKAKSFGKQLSLILSKVEKEILEQKPDKVLILGDTNSGLAAILAERLGIPVYHMEAGNRCYDLKVPEEKNRKVIDAIASYNLPYTPNSRENLIKEGFPKERIFTCGNPIYEVLTQYKEQIDESNILDRFGLVPGKFITVTAHRAENVDNEKRLRNVVSALETIAKSYPVIVSVHPRTQNKIKTFGIKTKNLIMEKPFGFFDFVKLESSSKCVITDSGTVQEECCLFDVPTITIRDTTERPETVECGSNIVSGLETEDILRCFNVMQAANLKWDYPIGYKDLRVSDKVVQFLLGK